MSNKDDKMSFNYRNKSSGVSLHNIFSYVCDQIKSKGYKYGHICFHQCLSSYVIYSEHVCTTVCMCVCLHIFLTW